MDQCVRAIIIRGEQLLLMHRLNHGREYYTLVGGHVEAGETLEQALRRELREETGLTVTVGRQVYVESDGAYGDQHIFLCTETSESTEFIAVAADADEAKANAEGRNTYQPVWKPWTELAELPFVSPSLKQHLLHDLAEGFQDSVQHFTLIKKEV